MALPNKIRVGSAVTHYPAGTHNWLVDNMSAQIARNGGGVMSSETQAAKRPPRIKNDTGSTISESFGVVKLEEPLEDVEKGPCESNRGVRFKGKAPAENEPFAILQRSADPDQYVSAVVSGETWADVDIKDEGHTTAGPIDDDTGKLESGKSGARILWKPKGTGVKRALVSLGGAAAKSDIVTVWVEETIDAASYDTGTKTVTYGEGSGVLIEGDAPADPEETIAVVNGTLTAIWASSEEPIVLEARLDSDLGKNADDLDQYKIISDKDFRSLPGFVKGTVVADDAQAPYHEGGSADFKLGREECPE